MRIIFVRHGHPNYEKDCLTPLGHKHGGASSAALAHFFNLPFPFVCSAICPDYTAVTVVALSEEEGALVAPKFELMNDARHIADIKKETEGFVYA